MMTLLDALCWPEQTGAVVVEDESAKARQVPWASVLADTENRVGPMLTEDYIDLARIGEKRRPIRYAYKMAAREYRN